VQVPETVGGSRSLGRERAPCSLVVQYHSRLWLHIVCNCCNMVMLLQCMRRQLQQGAQGGAWGKHCVQLLYTCRTKRHRWVP
jgi:hypothetical protein